MTAHILDGKELSATMELEIRAEVAARGAAGEPVPCLAAVLVGDNPASQVYVRNKEKACQRVGIASRLVRLPATTPQADLLQLIHELNDDPLVHGILVQLPLPAPLAEQAILDAIAPEKDVDCFHPENVGRLSQGRPRFLPCTPHGVIQLLHRSGIAVAGKRAVVLGRSDIVGKPLAMLLSAKDSPLGPDAANATVTLCHSRTRNLEQVCREAEILVAAIGIPRFVTPNMIQPGAVVIDVGINRTPTGLCGDVEFDGAAEIASAITPVPGGVGPLTIAMLLRNTLLAASLQSIPEK
jgi:methylenetetrahydrofolate dehydrogenase (NADP+)/methenyltetrahydrofolate cyclohydrolase